MVESFDWVTLIEPGRASPLVMRVSLPARGGRMPVVLFFHGDQSSKEDYQPLTAFWAAHGFAVIQPSHRDAAVYGLKPGDPERARVWRSRVADAEAILDGLGAIERQAPGLAGRLDASRVVVVGHSFGGHTAGVLAGAQPFDAVKGARVDLFDPRIKAAILLAPPGTTLGLTPEWRARAPYLDTDWSTVRRPMLVIVGASDVTTMSSRGAAWRMDAYADSPPGGRCLAVVAGARHYLGGIIGPHRTETVDEQPDQVRLVQELTLGYLHAAVGGVDPAWPMMAPDFAPRSPLLERFECK